MTDDQYDAAAERAERVIAMLTGDTNSEAIDDVIAAVIAAETLRTLALESENGAARRVVNLLVLEAAAERARREARVYLEENAALRKDLS